MIQNLRTIWIFLEFIAIHKWEILGWVSFIQMIRHWKRILQISCLILFVMYFKNTFKGVSSEQKTKKQIAETSEA